MKINLTVALMLLFFFFSLAEGSTLCSKRDSLFRIERSKNKNIVQYDACLLTNNEVSDSNPVHAYWINADGKKEELNLIQREKAYGIESKEKLGKNKYRISLAALKDRPLTVEKIKGDYKALIDINGKSSTLDRIYVKSRENALGLPKVHYVELYGRNLTTNKRVKERIIPS